jgi:phage tail tape-measure protein
MASGPGVLTRDDVRALFRLMVEVAQGPDSDETIAFSGRALAALFSSYADHLLKLMDEWPDLSKALQSDDAVGRARKLRERLLESGTCEPLRSIAGRPARIVGHPQADIGRSLIRGKGMEI